MLRAQNEQILLTQLYSLFEKKAEVKTAAAFKNDNTQFEGMLSPQMCGDQGTLCYTMVMIWCSSSVEK